MPMSCVAPNCSGRYRKGTTVGYFRIPSDFKRKKLWLQALSRENWEPKSYHRVCGAHFVKGRPTLDPNDVDFMPSVFNLNPKKEEKTPLKVDWKVEPLESQGTSKKTRATSTSDETREPSAVVKAVRVAVKVEKPPLIRVKSPVIKQAPKTDPPPPLVFGDSRLRSKPCVSVATQTIQADSIGTKTRMELTNHMVYEERGVCACVCVWCGVVCVCVCACVCVCVCSMWCLCVC